MAHGILVGCLISFAWILVQNLLMHVRPAENRFGAMLLGYLLSLPFVWILYRWMPPLTPGIAAGLNREAFGLGLTHACATHLLLYFF